MKKKLLLLLLLFLGTGGMCASEPTDSLETSGSDSLKCKRKFVENVKRKGNIILRFFREFNAYDSTYIVPNFYNFSTNLQNINSFQQYVVRAKNEMGETQSIAMAPTPTFKVGPYLGWRWISAGYTFDLAHLGGGEVVKKTDFNLSLYSNMLGADFIYRKNSGDFKLSRARGFEGVESRDVRGMIFDGLEAYTLTLNAYYVFNYRKFSYPAAFSQSTVQRKSCGSWIIGARYDHQKVKFDYTRLPGLLLGTPENPLLFDEMKFREFYYDNISISGGYAYNWAFAPRWLLAASLTPSIGFKKAHGENIEGKDEWINIKNVNFDAVCRLGLVWNNSHWYAGTSLVSNIYDYSTDKISFVNALHYFKIYVGFYFHKMKKFRKP